MDIADDILINKVAQGDTTAFKLLVERYQSAVLNTAYRFIGNSHEAEDIAQEVFLRLFEKAKYYKPIAQFKTWLFRIVTNLCLDFLKKKKPIYTDKFFDISSDTPIPSEEIEIIEYKKLVNNAIQTLLPNQRMALVLHHYERLRYKEIAKIMDCSVKSVESLLVRAKNTLRERLSGYMKGINGIG